MSNDIEKKVENLVVDLITPKDFLEAAYLEAKEHRVGASMAREKDTTNWERN